MRHLNIVTRHFSNLSQRGVHRFHPYKRPVECEENSSSNGQNGTTCLNGNANGNGNGVDGGEMMVPGWKERHASASEAIVKAERHGDTHSKETIEQLQEKTVQHIEEWTLKKQVIHVAEPKVKAEQWNQLVRDNDKRAKCEIDKISDKDKTGSK